MTIVNYCGAAELVGFETTFLVFGALQAGCTFVDKVAVVIVSVSINKVGYLAPPVINNSPHPLATFGFLVVALPVAVVVCTVCVLLGVNPVTTTAFLSVL